MTCSDDDVIVGMRLYRHIRSTGFIYSNTMGGTRIIFMKHCIFQEAVQSPIATLHRTFIFICCFFQEAVQSPIATLHHTLLDLGSYYSPQNIQAHIAVVNTPHLTVSVEEPGGQGGCGRDNLESVENTARLRGCLLAVNAGFFNTSSGACIGTAL